MKKYIITIFLALVTLTGWAQVDLLGSWTGKLDLGVAKLTLVFHLKQADGHVKVTMDSPDQSAMGIPCTKDFLSYDSLAVSVKSINASYSGRLKDGKIVGAFKQNGLSLPLVLAKGTEELRRPQTPQPPFPYETEEVTFRNERDSATLAGTLTWPVGYISEVEEETRRRPLHHRQRPGEPGRGNLRPQAFPRHC